MMIKRLLIGLFCALIAPVGDVCATDGLATYYTVKSCQKEGTSGVYTASGERYNENAMTCALRTRSWGRKWFVYGHETGKSVIVRNNDYGPGETQYYEQGHIIDLTPRAFKEVCGDLKLGKCKVSVQEAL